MFEHQVFFNFHRLFLLAEIITVKIALIANFFNWTSFQFIVAKYTIQLLHLFYKVLVFFNNICCHSLTAHNQRICPITVCYWKRPTACLSLLSIFTTTQTITIFVRPCHQNLPHQTELIEAIIIVSSLCSIVNIPDDTMT